MQRVELNRQLATRHPNAAFSRTSGALKRTRRVANSEEVKGVRSEPSALPACKMFFLERHSLVSTGSLTRIIALRRLANLKTNFA